MPTKFIIQSFLFLIILNYNTFSQELIKRKTATIVNLINTIGIVDSVTIYNGDYAIGKFSKKYISSLNPDENLIPLYNAISSAFEKKKINSLKNQYGFINSIEYINDSLFVILQGGFTLVNHKSFNPKLNQVIIDTGIKNKKRINAGSNLILNIFSLDDQLLEYFFNKTINESNFTTFKLILDNELIPLENDWWENLKYYFKKIIIKNDQLLNVNLQNGNSVCESSLLEQGYIKLFSRNIGLSNSPDPIKRINRNNKNAKKDISNLRVNIDLGIRAIWDFLPNYNLGVSLKYHQYSVFFSYTNLKSFDWLDKQDKIYPKIQKSIGESYLCLLEYDISRKQNERSIPPMIGMGFSAGFDISNYAYDEFHLNNSNPNQDLFSGRKYYRTKSIDGGVFFSESIPFFDRSITFNQGVLFSKSISKDKRNGVQIYFTIRIPIM